MGVIKIMIVDDHTVVRDGLVSMLVREDNFVVVGDASNGREAVDRARDLREATSSEMGPSTICFRRSTVHRGTP